MFLNFYVPRTFTILPGVYILQIRDIMGEEKSGILKRGKKNQGEEKEGKRGEKREERDKEGNRVEKEG